MPSPRKARPRLEDLPTIWEASGRPNRTGLARSSPSSTDPSLQGSRSTPVSAAAATSSPHRRGTRTAHQTRRRFRNGAALAPPRPMWLGAVPH